MKRLQIMINEDLDDALERQAHLEGTSKAALIRRFVREHVTPLPSIEDDSLWQLAGLVDGSPGDSAAIDEAVYGPPDE